MDGGIDGLIDMIAIGSRGMMIRRKRRELLVAGVVDRLALKER